MDNTFIQLMGTNLYVNPHGRVWKMGKITSGIPPLSGGVKYRCVDKEYIPFHAGYKSRYLCISTRHCKKTFRMYLHRAVAELFLPNPDGKPEVNHKDNDPHNNSVKNLEWVTRKENAMHHMGKGGCNFEKFREGRKVCAEKRKKPVLRGDGAEFPSLAEAASSVSGNPSWLLTNGIRKGLQTYGHFWEYKQLTLEAK